MTDTELEVRAYGKLMGWEFYVDAYHPFNPDPRRYKIHVVRPNTSTLFFSKWKVAHDYISNTEYRKALEQQASGDV